MLLGLLLLAGACEEANRNPPDAVLRDSLGVGEEARVWRIRVDGRGNRERVAPRVVTVPPGALVEFVTSDRRVHVVSFLPGTMSERAVRFLEETRQLGSPPLVEFGSRFVVSFHGAPPGRYRFVVEGNGEPTEGSVIVAAEDG